MHCLCGRLVVGTPTIHSQIHHLQPIPAKERPDTAAQYKIQLEGTIPAPLFLKKNCHQLLFWLPRPTSAWGRPIQLPLARSCHRFKKSGSRLGAVCWIAPHWI